MGRVMVMDSIEGVKTLQAQDTLDPRHFLRHFGTSDELCGHIGTSAESVLWTFWHQRRHFGTEQQYIKPL